MIRLEPIGVDRLHEVGRSSWTRRCCCSVGLAPNDLRAQLVGSTFSEIVAATSVPVAIAALHPDAGEGRVVVYSASRELAPGYVPTMALALELAATLSRGRDQPLTVGPVAPSELEAAGFTIPPTTEHLAGPRDLENGRQPPHARGISS
jgi:hypothetical protein